VSHSRKAAGEVAARLEEAGVSGVDARTFHAAALLLASRFHAEAGFNAAPSVASSRQAYALLAAGARRVLGTSVETQTLTDLNNEDSWARARSVGAEGYEAAASAARRAIAVTASSVAEVIAAFAEERRRAGVVDFADLLESGTKAIRVEGDAAAWARRRWAWVTVDEYQDTDPAQQAFLDAVLGPGSDLCVVGDPRQAIYAFKGGDPSFLLDFAQRRPDARVLALSSSYRCPATVLAVADVLARNLPSPAGVNLPPTRPAGAATRKAPKPLELVFDDADAEAAGLAAQISTLVKGGRRPGDIAVLTRFNGALPRIEAALAGAGIAINGNEDIAFLEAPERMVLLKAFGQAARQEPDAPGVAMLLRVAKDTASFDRSTQPAGHGAKAQAWEATDALIGLAEAPDHRTGTEAPASVVLAELRRLHSVGVELKSAAGVFVGTVHRAKGLEWPCVFVTGWQEGTLPSRFAQSASEALEERRIAYVAGTRAAEQLWLTRCAHAWTRSEHARPFPIDPSPFLDELTASATIDGLPPVRRKTRPDRAHTTAGLSNGSMPRAIPRPTADRGGAGCQVCQERLPTPAARKLGVCFACAARGPGDLGRRAKTLEQVRTNEAARLGCKPDDVCSMRGLYALLAGDEPATVAGLHKDPTARKALVDGAEATSS